MKRSISFSKVGFCLLLLFVAMALGSTLGLKDADAQSKKDALAFYKGKNLKLIVPYKPGGGYDTYARLMAPYFQEYTGARVIVINRPGAAGLLGINETYTARPNGLTMVIMPATPAIMNQMASMGGIRFDMTKFSWIGRVGYDRRVLALRSDSPYKTYELFKNAKTPVKIACGGLGDSNYVCAAVSREMLGIPLELVLGYSSASDVERSLLRGDTGAMYGSWGSRRRMVAAGEQFIVLQSGEKRHPDLPNIPTWVEVAPTDMAKRVLSTLNFLFEAGRPLATAPGVPGERVALLREAFHKTMHHPNFIKAVQKAKRELDYLSGEEMEQVVKNTLETPKEDVRKILLKAFKGEFK